MNGIDKISQRIQGDAQAEIDKIAAENQAQVDAVTADYQAQVNREREAILAKGRRQAAERLEQLQSAARMETRKMELAAKQEVLSQAFDKALEQLCSLPDQQYIELLTKLVMAAASTGKEQIIFSQKDRNRIGKQVVIAANEALDKLSMEHGTAVHAPKIPGVKEDGKIAAAMDVIADIATVAKYMGSHALTLSEETRPMEGGFILADGAVEINCSFESLVRLQREKLELAVAGILFP